MLQTTSRFLQACRRQPTDRTPIWLMRQAGRYLPEYRAIRAKTSMLDAIRTPEIAHEITMQPIRTFDLDAAILFSDILTPLIEMGLDVSFEAGEGPHLANPIRAEADVIALRTPDPREAMPYTFATIRSLVAELTPRGLPLIGFAGAPFTLASYAIEGGGSRNYEHTKALMWNAPETWRGLMEKLVTVVGDYLLAQAEAGASALQVFDSWAGALSPSDYATFVAPFNKALFERLRSANVPTIYFSTGTGTLLDQIASFPCDVVSVDWRIRLDNAWSCLGPDKAIQGNLDPVLLATAPWPVIQTATDDLLAQAGGRPGHIFNLGHGVLPGTPVDSVRRLVDYVYERGRSRTLTAI